MRLFKRASIYFVLSLWLFIFSASTNTALKADYHVDLYKRKSFWVPLPKRGWLYKDCSVTLLEPLPNYATSSEAVLSGKSETATTTHFLFRFRFVGLYRFCFIYQNYDSDYDGTYKNGELYYITVLATDSSNGFKDFSAVYDSQPISSAKELPLLDKNKNEGKNGSATETSAEQVSSKENNLKSGSLSASTEIEKNSINSKGAFFDVKGHRLFPTDKKIEELLQDISISSEPYFRERDKDAFSLALYFLSQNSSRALKEAHYWFSYLVKRYPESSLVHEAQSYIDFINQHYLLIR